jgi:large subunit ribosomal protein L15
MKLSELKSPAGARKRKRRVGRGQGSGRGGTSGKGHKGQKSRSGGKIPPWFEGGQMPLARRLPIKGFKNPSRRQFEIINVSDLERSGLEGTVTVTDLRQKRILTSKKPVKVLGNGEISRAIDLKVNAVSKTAREKITAAGGSVELIG